MAHSSTTRSLVASSSYLSQRVPSLQEGTQALVCLFNAASRSSIRSVFSPAFGPGSPGPFSESAHFPRRRPGHVQCFSLRQPGRTPSLLHHAAAAVRACKRPPPLGPFKFSSPPLGLRLWRCPCQTLPGRSPLRDINDNHRRRPGPLPVHPRWPKLLCAPVVGTTVGYVSLPHLPRATRSLGRPHQPCCLRRRLRTSTVLSRATRRPLTREHGCVPGPSCNRLPSDSADQANNPLRPRFRATTPPSSAGYIGLRLLPRATWTPPIHLAVFAVDFAPQQLCTPATRRPHIHERGCVPCRSAWGSPNNSADRACIHAALFRTSLPRTKGPHHGRLHRPPPPTSRDSDAAIDFAVDFAPQQPYPDIRTPHIR